MTEPTTAGTGPTCPHRGATGPAGTGQAATKPAGTGQAATEPTDPHGTATEPTGTGRAAHRPAGVPDWPAGVDLASLAVHAERGLRDIWRELREEQPVAWHPYGAAGFWVVSTHRLAIEVFRDGETYTSTRGNVLATLLNGGDSAGGRMLAVSDGPRHQFVRRALNTTFTRSALTGLAEQIQQAVRRGAAEHGTCDFAVDVAPAIPLAAICDLLGVPAADRPELFGYASAALAADSPEASELDARLARNQILLYFQRLTRRSGHGQGAALRRLLDLTEGPSALTEDELLLNCYSLLLGGDETSRLAIIGMVRALAQRPEQWDRLRRGEVSVASAVEEMLRWTTPAVHAGRTATRDTVLGGRNIAAGDVVTVWMASGNFDPAEFRQPEELDLSRPGNRHLSFAYGPHFCLGAHLARIELGAVLTALVEYVDRIELVGPPEPIYSNFLSGFRSLPVRLTRRPGAPTQT